MRPMPGNYQSDAPSVSISSLDTNNDDFAQSTRPNLEDDEQRHGRLRTTAKKRGQYSLPQLQDPIRSSALRNSFKDFTKDFSDEKDNMDQDSSLELEVGRGMPRNSRGTPSKLHHSYMASDVILDLGASSPFDIKAGPRSRQIRKSAVAEGDMRKNAQIRRASSQKVDRTSHRMPVASGQNTYTEESFALPDVTGLSKIIDTAMEPRSQAIKHRSRYSHGHRVVSHSDEQYVPVETVPVSDENKWQMLALHSLHERIKSLEQDNSKLLNECQQYKTNVEELEAELNIERTMRKADSALGSDDGKGGKRSEILKLQVSNVRLEADNRRLSRRVRELEEQADNSENLTKRMVNERNKLARDLSATQDQQSIKTRHENSLLKKEKKILCERVDELQAVNNELRAQLDDTQARHDDATQDLTQRLRDLEIQAVRGDSAVIAENQTLRLQLDQLRASYDHDVQKLRNEAENRRATARAAQAEYVRLQAQHRQLQQDLQAAREKQQNNHRQVDARSTSNAGAQIRLNDDLRRSNDALLAELAKLRAEVASERRVNARERSKSTNRSKTASLRQRVDSPIDLQVHDLVSEDGFENGIATQTVGRHLSRGSQRQSTNPDEADTYLTLMSEEEIMRIRKAVEQEYAAKRGRSEFIPAEAANRPKPPTANRGDENSTRLQSSKQTDFGVADDSTAQQNTYKSRPSSVAARRRAINDDEAGMTSAFIIPDITLKVPGARPTLSTSARHVLSNLAPHSPRQCTVCHRIVSAQNPAAAPQSPKIVTPVPVSALSPMQTEIDATLRPSEPPLKALSRVIRQLADEIAHLKLELHTIERRLAAHDPARSKRERDSLHEAIEGLNKSIQIKSDQMYSLYDVLEGHKIDVNQKDAALAAQALEDDITNDVREILEELKAGRRVTIKSPPMSYAQSHKVLLEDGIEVDDERPWDGFSETGSVHTRQL